MLNLLATPGRVLCGPARSLRMIPSDQSGSATQPITHAAEGTRTAADCRRGAGRDRSVRLRQLAVAVQVILEAAANGRLFRLSALRRQ